MKSIPRRTFLRHSALAGIAILADANSARTYAQNNRLSIGCIGVGGRGKTHVDEASREHIVALCDVDRKRLGQAATWHPKAKTYADYRRLFDAEKGLNAVFVATPDHSHFLAVMAAVERGLGVYCEKPLTHSVWEARTLTAAAVRRKVPSQLGNQGHSGEGPRLVCEFVWDGAIGPVREAHVWGPAGASGGYANILRRKREPAPTPPHLDWDLWIGPAPFRTYQTGLHPGSWRGVWDFGTGPLGDFGCHWIDKTYWALRLADTKTVTVEAEHEGCTTDRAPLWSIVTYHFPARGTMPPVRLVWYDGGKKPPVPEELKREGRGLSDHGTLLVGDKGKMLDHRLIPEARMRQYKVPPKSIPRSKGHHADFFVACKGGAQASSHFGYSGRLAEIVLLGNVAIRTGERIEYDFGTGKVINCPKAEPYLCRPYRKGWSWGVAT